MPSPLIAVVEDEEHLAQGLLFNLEAEGYRTHHEADGNAALAWLLNTPEPPAAVLLDVMLPGQDGFSIVRALREAGRFIPVLLLTARGRSEDIVEGFSAGADDYLRSPSISTSCSRVCPGFFAASIGPRTRKQQIQKPPAPRHPRLLPKSPSNNPHSSSAIARSTSTPSRSAALSRPSISP